MAHPGATLFVKRAPWIVLALLCTTLALSALAGLHISQNGVVFVTSDRAFKIQSNAEVQRSDALEEVVENRAQPKEDEDEEEREDREREFINDSVNIVYQDLSENRVRPRPCPPRAPRCAFC